MIGIILIPLAIFLVLVFRRNQTTKYGAPFVPLEHEVVNRVIEMADIKKDDVFYDLGSGDGRIVIAAAIKGAKAYGIEVDFFRALYSQIWILLLGLSDRAKIIHKNINDVDLSEADIVTAYLLQETNDLFSNKLNCELKSGTKILGIAFMFPIWKLIKIEPRGPIYGPIYLYKK